MKYSLIIFLTVSCLSTDPQNQNTKIVTVKESVLGKSLQMSYPINDKWHKQCGILIKDQVKNSFLSENVIQFFDSILIRGPRSAIGINKNGNELQVLFNDLELCDLDDIQKGLNDLHEELNEGLNPEIPKLDHNWTFARSREFIEKRNFSAKHLSIFARSSWQARSARGGMSAMPRHLIDGIVLHNTEYKSSDSVRRVQNLHMDRNNWSDIGYHFVIAKSQGQWKVFKGRELTLLGAHVGRGKNRYKIGIAIQGDFNQRTASSHPNGYSPGAAEHLRQPEPLAIEELGKLLEHLKNQLGELPMIYSHGLGAHAANPGHTDCPGKAMLHVVKSFKFKHDA